MERSRQSEEINLSNDSDVESVDSAVAQMSPHLSNVGISTGTTSIESLVGSTAKTDTSIPPTAEVSASSSTTCENGVPHKISDTSSDADSRTRREYKPRVVKVEHKGIYTVKTFESVNILGEWVKALQTSTPYLLRLFKIFWTLSPTRVSILIAANLSKAMIPSLVVLNNKRFLDQVQRVVKGRATNWKRMILLIFLGAGIQITSHGLNVVS